MPLYEYQCRGCGRQFELLIRASDSSQPACPSCSSQDLERLLSMFSASSDSTQRVAYEDGRRRGAAIKKEKDHAFLEEIKHHNH